jgi:hypothetical protein
MGYCVAVSQSIDLPCYCRASAGLLRVCISVRDHANATSGVNVCRSSRGTSRCDFVGRVTSRAAVTASHCLPNTTSRYPAIHCCCSYWNTLPGLERPTPPPPCCPQSSDHIPQPTDDGYGAAGGAADKEAQLLHRRPAIGLDSLWRSKVQIRGDPQHVQHAIHRSPCVAGIQQDASKSSSPVRSDNDVRLTIPIRPLLGQKDHEAREGWTDASGPQHFSSPVTTPGKKKQIVHVARARANHPVYRHICCAPIPSSPPPR